MYQFNHTCKIYRYLEFRINMRQYGKPPMILNYFWNIWVKKNFVVKATYTGMCFHGFDASASRCDIWALGEHLGVVPCASVHTFLNIIRIMYVRVKFHYFIYNKHWIFYFRHYTSCYISNKVRTHWYRQCFCDFDNFPTELLPCATTATLCYLVPQR